MTITQTQTALSVITDDEDDFLQLQQTIQDADLGLLFSMKHHPEISPAIQQELNNHRCLIVARITMNGFFDMLKALDRSKVTVVALVEDLPEEIVTAKLIGLEYIKKSALSRQGVAHYLQQTGME